MKSLTLFSNLRGPQLVLCACLIAATNVGCSASDVSDEPAYAQMVGRQYRIIGEVDAYGIKEELQDEKASYVTLIPRPGIGGPEVAFKVTMPKGQIFRIRRAMREFRLLDNQIDYVVELQNSGLAPGVEVRISLFRGNEGSEIELNPRLYERVP